MKQGFLKIQHGFGYAPDAPYEEKFRQVSRTLEKIKEDGYDGIVTNVAFATHLTDNFNETITARTTGCYLQDADELRLMKDKAALCRKLGLRMWLYDEDGYPSGSAGGLTLQENPEFECRSAVMMHQILSPGESAEFPLPRGHEKPISAFAYAVTADTPTVQELQAKPLRANFEDGAFRFCNATNGKLLCMSFFAKKQYEGAHCHHNVYSSRRYVDIGNKEAISAFYRNTYQTYFDLLREDIADGTVEAVFTDEPSYMGRYINAGLYPAHITDPYDDTLPLYPVVNWSRDLEATFQAAKGYDIADHMPALFIPGDADFARVRQDFYEVLSQMSENAFFKTLGDGCGENQVNFSGHILLEDRLWCHPAFEGNFFQLLRHMQTPGMDMLHAEPEQVWNNAFTPILVRSISELYRDGHIMDEISCHQKTDVTTEQIFNAIMQQFCLGADVFTSYFSDRVLEKTAAGETVLRKVQQLMAQFPQRTLPKIILHYPIEDMMQATVAAEAGLGLDEEAAQRNRLVGQRFWDCMYGLLDSQLPFYLSDTSSLPLTAEHEPRYLVVSGAVSEALQQQVARLEGCRLLALPENGDFTAIRQTLLDAGLAQATGDTEGIAMLHSADRILLVNAHNREKTIHLPQSLCSARCCFTDEDAAWHTDADGTRLTLPPYGVVLASVR